MYENDKKNRYKIREKFIMKYEIRVLINRFRRDVATRSIIFTKSFSLIKTFLVASSIL